MEIALSDTGNIEKNNLTARLASPDAFSAAGVDYPYNLSKLKFEIESHDGHSYIQVTSRGPINDPYITLLVELNWSSGRLLREYTFLIDPPGYRAEQLKPEPVAPIEPVVTAVPEVEAVPAPVVPETTAPEKTPAPAEEMAASTPAAVPPSTELVAAVPAPAAVPATKEKGAAPAAMEELAAPTEAVPAPVSSAGKVEARQPRVKKTITVKRGDNLTRIAERIQEPDVTLEQMLVALYRANVNKFDGKNMNRIRAGKILRMPSQAVLEKLSQTDAVKEIRIQTADWNAYRQKLAAVRAPAPKQAPKQETSGKISTAVADKTPAVKKSAKEVLKLSKGAAPGDKTAAGGKAMTPQEKANAKQEEAIAKGKAKKETGQREAMLEKNVKEMQKLVELKGQPAKPAPQPPAPPAKAKGAQPAAPAAHPPLRPLAKKPRIMLPPPAPAPTSMVDSVLDTIKGIVSMVVSAAPGIVSAVTGNPLYLGGLGALVLVVLGFYIIRRRGGGGGKKKKITPKKLKKKLKSRKPLEDLAFTAEESASEDTLIEHQPIAEAEEPLESTVAHVAAVSPPVMGAEEEEVDPISEAELFLNFGRDAQAEEILKDALSRNPSNRTAQLKLLSIYVNRKDANSFSTIARQIKDSGDAEAWEQTAAMGREVDPSNPMYGGTGSGAVAAPEVLAESGAQEAAPPPLDMDIGFNVPMDLDVTASTPAVTTEAGETMDFDISGQTSAPTDFDVTATVPVVPADADETMDFDISGQTSAPTDFDVTSAAPSISADDMGVSFDITGSQPKATEGMDFNITGSQPNVTEGMDFNITGSQPKATEGMDFNITGSQPNATDHMDFDVTGSHPNVTEHTDFDVTGGHPEMSDELHMDFDVTSSHPAVTEIAAEDENQTTVMLSAPMDFDVSAAPTESAEPSILETEGLSFDVSSSHAAQAPALDVDLGGISLDMGDEVTTLVSPVAEAKQDEKWHEVATKLDLARAYQEMGDADGAREILGEVIRDGDDQQQEAAQTLMQQL